MLDFNVVGEILSSWNMCYSIIGANKVKKVRYERKLWVINNSIISILAISFLCLDFWHNVSNVGVDDEPVY